MRSLIKTYSIEERDSAGLPSGNFYLNREGASKVAKEVVGTHFQWTGEKRDQFLSDKFPKLWSYFDVNN